MRPSISILPLLVLTACGETRSEQAPAKDAVLAANAAKDEAMIARDAAGLARFYTDDYQVIDDDAKVHDKRDQVQFMTEEVELLKARSDDVRVSMLAPDTALVTGRLTGRYRMNNKESDFTERDTGIWVREGEAGA